MGDHKMSQFVITDATLLQEAMNLLDQHCEFINSICTPDVYTEIQQDDLAERLIALHEKVAKHHVTTGIARTATRRSTEA